MTDQLVMTSYMHWMNTRMQRGIFNSVMINEPKATEPRWWEISCKTDFPATHAKLLLSLCKYKEKVAWTLSRTYSNVAHRCNESRMSNLLQHPKTSTRCEQL